MKTSIEKVQNEWGYTNSDEHIEAVRQFVKDAIADEWLQEKYYDSETLDQSCKLYKNGFEVSVLTRNLNGSRWKYQASINAWADDGLAIRLPLRYDWKVFENAKTTCNICLATNVQTQRYSFAGRCCENCISDARKEHEYPGWCE